MKTKPILFGLCLALTGCATLPLEQQQAQVQALVDARQTFETSSHATYEGGVELTREAAISLALSQSPRANALQARLGLARADAMAAMRLSNPSLSFARMTSANGEKEITRSIGLDLADALLLPVRRRYATEELARQRLLIAEQLIDLALDAESLWWRAGAAAQVLRVRAAARDAAEASAQLAERYFQAGNISQMQWQRERAVAAEYLIAAARAELEALRLRNRLVVLLGLAPGIELKLPERLHLPPESVLERATLFSLAEQNALQLAAARAEVALAERGLRWQRRWRWLGGAELEYERESEGQSAVLRGPQLTLSLPIFHQNQAEVAHAQSALAMAQAELEQRLLEGSAAIDTGLMQLQQQRRAIATYREVLLKAHELIVSEQQLRFNFMLIGAFELIEARRAQYDAYEAYIEAIRDGWLACIDLKRAVGSDPFSEQDKPLETFDANEIFHSPPEAEQPSMNHDHMDHSKMNHAAPESEPADQPTQAADHSAHSHGDKP